MRKIIHVDMDAFFASVEQRDDPSLIGKPVIVGGRPASRGVVAACSYEARKFGIHSAMPSARAAKLCPEAIFLRPRFEAYRECSIVIQQIFREVTPLVEPLSLDEAYLDVSAETCYEEQHRQSATLLARDIKQRIKDRVNLTASAGVSYNKFLAKIASDMDKPDGVYVIKPQDAEAFIEGLDVRKFHGVGKVTEKKLHGLGIYTGLDLKQKDLPWLNQYFGNSAQYYYNIARGIDERPVRHQRIRKSIGKETTMGEDVLNKHQIWETLQGLVIRIVDVMHSKEIVAKTLTLKVKYNDFTLITRSKTISEVITSQEQILALLPELLRKTDVGKRPIRLIGVSVSNLFNPEGVGQTKENKSQIPLF